jgi:formate hydrogenlyase subunit 6/NADH:ubiquinone oxidoreductase subunit I
VKAKKTYWSAIIQAISSSHTGLRLTLGHLFKARKSKTSTNIREANYFSSQQGIATIQYPHETIPVPDNGRYQLHNEIDDCIVCDKCANICPVNCITIEPIRSPEEFGKTSDGTPKRIYAAKFDINMSQCCFCGLCTTVCPTECLTMTKNYEFSSFDVAEHTFPFADMLADQIAAKKSEWEEFQKHKIEKVAPVIPTSSPAKPVFRPKMKPASGSAESES